jgi:hypothetical protein
VTDDPVDRLLSRLENVRPISTGGHVARCPAHHDQHNSLKIDRGENGQALIYCHTGCTPEQVTAALDLSLADLFVAPDPAVLIRSNGHARKLIRTTRYEIPTVDGEARAVHVREDYSDGSKRMWWETPDGRQGLNGIKLSDLQLYGLPSLQDSEEVVVVEGEKAGDAGRSLGVPFVATVTGASAIPSDASLAPLLGRTVYLWPDRDEPGLKHMDRIAHRLMSSVRSMIRSDALNGRRHRRRATSPTGLRRVASRSICASGLIWPLCGSLMKPRTPTESQGARALSHAQLLTLELPQRRPLVEQLIDEETGCIIAGPGGTGKTWLALDLARAIASGTPWLGHFPTNQAPVLIIDEEGNERGIQDRLRLMNASLPLDDPPIWFVIGLGLKIDADQTRAVIEEEIDRYRPGVVIFDSLTRIHSANENDASEMSRVFARFSALRRDYGCTVVLIDHLRKKGLINDEAEMLRGSTDKRNWPDTILFASPGERGSLTVSHIKARYGEAVDEFGVALEIDNAAGTARIRYQGHVPSAHHGKGNDIIAAIHALKAQLGEDAASIMTIAAWLDVSDETVRKHIKRLVYGTKIDFWAASTPATSFVYRPRFATAIR